MLKASQMPRKGFTADYVFEVTDGDAVAGTINSTRMTIDLGGRGFSILRKGFLGPEFQLKSGATIVATATQKAFFSNFKLVCDGKEWRFKAKGMLANAFGLYENDKETGSVAAGPALNRMKDITAELPAGLLPEVRVFLILLAIHVWQQQSSN